MDQSELIGELTTESLEHIAEIESDILSFEGFGTEVPSEILNRVFRDVHSIKGGFSFFGFENIHFYYLSCKHGLYNRIVLLFAQR